MHALANIADNPLIAESIQAQKDADLLDKIGAALRAAMGAGALEMLPEVIAALRISDNIDAKLKFLQMAMKEGGYAAKEKKQDNLPTFAFNFITQGGVQHVQVTATPAQPDQALPHQPEDIIDVVATPATNAPAQPPAFALLLAANDDFEPPKTHAESVLDMIDLG